MANQTFGSFCSGCGLNHSTADCPWKPAVSGINLTVPTSSVNPWDNQVGGQHYKKGIQPFEYAMVNNLNSLEFSVVKYLRKKGDKADRIKDLNKAKDCLEKLIWWEEHDGKI